MTNMLNEPLPEEVKERLGEEPPGEAEGGLVRVLEHAVVRDRLRDVEVGLGGEEAGRVRHLVVEPGADGLEPL